MRQHVPEYLREVTQQISFRKRWLLERRVGWPIHAVEMRNAELVRTDSEGERVLGVVQLPHDAAGLGVVFGCACLTLSAAHVLRVHVVAKAQKHWCAQEAVVSPVLVFHLC